MATKGPARPKKQKHDISKIEDTLATVLTQIKAEFPKPAAEDGAASIIDAQSYVVYDSDRRNARTTFFQAWKEMKSALSALRGTPYFSTKTPKK